MHVFVSKFNRRKRDFNMNPPCTLDFMVLQITGSNQRIIKLCSKNVPGEIKKTRTSISKCGFLENASNTLEIS